MTGIGIDADAFVEEANELLQEVDHALIQFRQAPTDPRLLIGQVYRSMYAIANLGEIFGFGEASRFALQIVQVLEPIRNGIAPIPLELLVLIHAATEHVWALLRVAVNPDQGGEILHSLQVLMAPA